MSRSQREKSQGKTGSVKLFGRNGRHFKRSDESIGEGRKGGAHFLRSNRRHNNHHTEDFLSGYAD